MKVIVKLNTGRTFNANVPDSFNDDQIINLVNDEISLWNEKVVKILSKEPSTFDAQKLVMSDEEVIDYVEELRYASVIDALKIQVFYNKVKETFKNIVRCKWHDLKKDPTDLPEVHSCMREPIEYRSDNNIIITTKYNTLSIGQLVKREEPDMYGHTMWWVTGQDKYYPEDVYAWKYVDTFEKTATE